MRGKTIHLETNQVTALNCHLLPEEVADEASAATLHSGPAIANRGCSPPTLVWTNWSGLYSVSCIFVKIMEKLELSTLPGGM